MLVFDDVIDSSFDSIDSSFKLSAHGSLVSIETEVSAFNYVSLEIILPHWR